MIIWIHHFPLIAHMLFSLRIYIRYLLSAVKNNIIVVCIGTRAVKYMWRARKRKVSLVAEVNGCDRHYVAF